MAELLISEALQIHGANGDQQGHPLEDLYRLQRGYRIAVATDEIRTNTIASTLKKEDVPPRVYAGCERLDVSIEGTTAAVIVAIGHSIRDGSHAKF